MNRRVLATVFAGGVFQIGSMVAGRKLLTIRSSGRLIKRATAELKRCP
jgi:hypothetical protein